MATLDWIGLDLIGLDWTRIKFKAIIEYFYQFITYFYPFNTTI